MTTERIRPMNVEQAWTVEWSKSQDFFHVALLDQRARENFRRYRDGAQAGDWIFLGIFSTLKEAHEFIDQSKCDKRTHGYL